MLNFNYDILYKISNSVNPSDLSLLPVTNNIIYKYDWENQYYQLFNNKFELIFDTKNKDKLLTKIKDIINDNINLSLLK